MNLHSNTSDIVELSEAMLARSARRIPEPGRLHHRSRDEAGLRLCEGVRARPGRRPRRSAADARCGLTTLRTVDIGLIPRLAMSMDAVRFAGEIGTGSRNEPEASPWSTSPMVHVGALGGLRQAHVPRQHRHGGVRVERHARRWRPARIEREQGDDGRGRPERRRRRRHRDHGRRSRLTPCQTIARPRSNTPRPDRSGAWRVRRIGLGGVYDQAWPRWYATYAVEHGVGALIGGGITIDRLAEFLAGSNVEFEPRPSREPWARMRRGGSPRS